MKHLIRILAPFGIAVVILASLTTPARAESGGFNPWWGSVYYNDADNANGNDTIKVCDKANMSSDYDGVWGWVGIRWRDGSFHGVGAKIWSPNPSSRCRLVRNGGSAVKRYYKVNREHADVKIILCRYKPDTSRTTDCRVKIIDGEPRG